MNKQAYIAALKEAWQFLNQVEVKGSSVFPMFQAMARIEGVIVNMEKEDQKKEGENDV